MIHVQGVSVCVWGGELGCWSHPIISTSWQVKVEEDGSVQPYNQPDAGQ